MANRYLSREVRFWSKVDKTSGCWLWKGYANAGKYGRFRDAGKQALAHRVAYELTHGALDSTVTLDHLCRNKICVNPAHLEPVSRGENVRRWAAGITACPHGHTYDDANTYVDKVGKRSCRACARDRARRRYAARTTSAGGGNA